jgi:cytochrome c oxidase subunit 2
MSLLSACTGPGHDNQPAGQKDSLEITLIGRKSVWTAQYPGSDGHCGKIRFLKKGRPAIDPGHTASVNDFLATDTLHLPEHCQLLFRFISIDVIHSAYFPQMRLQMNVVPGMYTLLHYASPGRSPVCLDLLCNRICGPQHFQMQMKVLIESRERFDQWCKKRKTGMPVSL